MRKLRNNELDRLSIEAFKTASKLPVTVILDNVRSLNNVGSVFRTSDAFRLEKIILCGITACPPHKEIHKTALGAEDSVDWEYYEDPMEAINKLKTEKYTICSIEQVENSKSLPVLKLSGDQKYALVFGNEVRGVQQNIVTNSDMSIEIPQHGTKHSLNISVSAGIVMWEFYKQLSADFL